jgi:protein AroM
MDQVKPLLGENIEVVEYGVLDDLSTEQIESLAPLEQEMRLVSRLRDGRQVLLSERKVSELLPEVIKFISGEMDVEAVGVLCTHKFPKKEFPCPVIFPAEHTKTHIDELSDVQKLGLVVPLEIQIEMTKRKWGHKRAVVVPKSPYVVGITWKDVADTLIDEKVDAVILDCIGFTLKDRDEIRSFLDIPILLPRTILASAINQMF